MDLLRHRVHGHQRVLAEVGSGDVAAPLPRYIESVYDARRHCSALEWPKRQINGRQGIETRGLVGLPHRPTRLKLQKWQL